MTGVGRGPDHPRGPDRGWVLRVVGERAAGGRCHSLTANPSEAALGRCQSLTANHGWRLTHLTGCPDDAYCWTKFTNIAREKPEKKVNPTRGHQRFLKSFSPLCKKRLLVTQPANMLLKNWIRPGVRFWRILVCWRNILQQYDRASFIVLQQITYLAQYVFDIYEQDIFQVEMSVFRTTNSPPYIGP